MSSFQQVLLTVGLVALSAFPAKGASKDTLPAVRADCSLVLPSPMGGSLAGPFAPGRWTRESLSLEEVSRTSPDVLQLGGMSMGMSARPSEGLLTPTLGSLSLDGSLSPSGGPHSGSMQEDLLALVREIEDPVSADPRLRFRDLTVRYPEEVVVQALARILATGSTDARYQAARLLGQANGPIPTLILLDEARRGRYRSLTLVIMKALKKKYGSMDPVCPIDEGQLFRLLDEIAEKPPMDVLEHLIPLLSSYPEWRIPIVRTLAKIGSRQSIRPIQGLIGSSDELDAEALGALMMLGCDYELNRARLAQALPRAVELGAQGLGAFQSIVFYLREAALANNDPAAAKPLFYIVPHGNEPFRTQAMASLHKISVAAPRVFVSGLAMIAPADRDEFIPDLVAYLHQKDLEAEFMSTWHMAFRDLDLSFPYPDLVQTIERGVREKVQ